MRIPGYGGIWNSDTVSVDKRAESGHTGGSLACLWGCYVARLSADIAQDFCHIAAYSVQANRRAVRGSLDLDVSIAAGTRCGQAAGSVPLDDVLVSVSR